jgi:hypothetical protein
LRSLWRLISAASSSSGVASSSGVVFGIDTPVAPAASGSVAVSPLRNKRFLDFVSDFVQTYVSFQILFQI